MHFFFKTLVAWRWFIVRSALATAIVVAAVSFVLPKWYTASTSVFPPEPSSGSPMYAEVLQNLSLPLLGPMASGIAPETIYIDMLRSRRIGAQLIEEFDLKELYNVELMEQALGVLHARTGFTLLENGLLLVTFEDRDPERAATILNRMIELLDELNRQLNITRASRTRAFIEGQLEKRERDLAAAEDSLSQFQERNQALDLDQQLQAAMDIVTQLTSKAIALESELEILSHYTSTTSEEYQRKKLEYEEIVSQLASLKVDDVENDEDMIRSFIPSLDDVPQLALQMLRLRRRVDIESSVYTMLTKEYEKARFEEARDMSTLQVLDRAEPPNLRSRPRRKLLVLVGLLFGLGWSSLLALAVTSWRENRENSVVIRDVLQPVVSDIRRLLRR